MTKIILGLILKFEKRPVATAKMCGGLEWRYMHSDDKYANGSICNTNIDTDHFHQWDSVSQRH